MVGFTLEAFLTIREMSALDYSSALDFSDDSLICS